MSDTEKVDDFYEEDEPITEIRARFHAGEKGLTAPFSTGLRMTDVDRVAIHGVRALTRPGVVVPSVTGAQARP